MTSIQACQLDLKILVKNFKFGVGFLESGQCTFDQVLANDQITDEYQEFLSFMGPKTSLYGATTYTGGLDTKDHSSVAICTKTRVLDRTHEVVFHVNQWIPHAAHDKSYVDRKRHLGNNLVIILYTQKTISFFDPASIKSKQTKAVCIVHPRVDGNGYQMEVSYLFAERTKEYMHFAHNEKNQFIQARKSTASSPLCPTPFITSLYFPCVVIRIEKECYKAEDIANKLQRVRAFTIRELIDG